MRTLLRTQSASTALFIVMESLAWWIGLRAVASGVTRDGYASMAERIERAGTAIGDPVRVQRAIEITRDVAAHGMGGPSFLIVLAAAAGAFLLVRWIVDQKLPLSVAAGIGIAASLVAFQLLVRLSLAGDFRIWEAVPVLRASVNGGQADQADLAAFVASPNGSLPVRGALTMSAGVLALVWLRFLIAGRSAMSYERVLRSFGVGFVILLALTAWTAIGESVDVFSWVPVYFVVGVAALAVAQAARARPTEDETGRLEPWVSSLGITLGGIALIALVFTFLTFLDGGRIMQPVIAGVVWVIGKIAWAVLYPFAVVMQAIVSFVLGGRTLHLDQFSMDAFEMPKPPVNGKTTDSLIPSWLSFGVRALAIIAVGYGLYRIGLVVFAARHRTREVDDETRLRSHTSEDVPSSLFGGLFRRRRGDDAMAGDWLRRHAVYELFARVVRSARERGIERTLGSTPLEFAQDAGVRLDAPSFEPIGRAFDQARYGRHFPERAELDVLERDLGEWERTHVERAASPPSEERRGE